MTTSHYWLEEMMQIILHNQRSKQDIADIVMQTQASYTKLVDTSVLTSTTRKRGRCDRNLPPLVECCQIARKKNVYAKMIKTILKNDDKIASRWNIRPNMSAQKIIFS